MKIRQLSDLHLETGPFTWEDQGEDVVVLAGDIGVGVAGIEWAKTITKPVVYVAGNHENWDGDIYENIKAMRLAAKGSNVHFLENDEVNLTVNGETARILGCTLWTDFGEAHCEKHPMVLSRDHVPHHSLMHHAAHWMNDYRYIKAKAWWTPENEVRYKEIFDVIRVKENQFNPLAAYDLHTESRNWLADRLSEECSHRTVIVTHHAPSYQSLKEAHMINEGVLNQQRWSFSRRDENGLYRVAAYASDMESYFGRKSWNGSGVDLWLHGHTHARVQYAMKGTVVSCNPRGYHQKPISQEEADTSRFWGYPVSKDAIERSKNIYAKNPERGDNQDFERNLVIDLDTMLPELVIRIARNMLEDLPPILDDVLSHKSYLARKDEVVVKLTGNHLASQAEEFNKLVKGILNYLKGALKKNDRGSFSNDNYSIAVDLGFTKNHMHLKSRRAENAVINFSVNSNFYMPDKRSQELADEGFSSFNVQPKIWGSRVIKEMQKTIRAFDQRLDECVQKISE